MSMFDLIRSLSDADIDFVLVGGLAVALHGYQRVTMDVDVVLAMTPENLRRFIACAKAAGLRPVIPFPSMRWPIPIGSSNGIARRACSPSHCAGPT